MAFGLRREASHQIDDAEAAQNRRKDDPVSPPARPLENVGGVGDLEHAIDHHIMDQTDEHAQRHRAYAGQDANAQRQEAEGEQAHTPFIARAGGQGLGRNRSFGGR
jgi:hypothetical protein